MEELNIFFKVRLTGQAENIYMTREFMLNILLPCLNVHILIWAHIGNIYPGK